MTVIVKAKSIKHVDITDLRNKLLELSDRCQRLENVLNSESIDITVINDEFLDFHTGDTMDEMAAISRQVDNLLDPYKERLLREFLSSMRA